MTIEQQGCAPMLSFTNTKTTAYTPESVILPVSYDAHKFGYTALVEVYCAKVETYRETIQATSTEHTDDANLP